MGHVLNATDPDLGAFARRGGTWHAALFRGPGPSGFGGLAAAPQPLNPAIDLSAALERWVEDGIAPESVRAIRARDMVRALFDPGQPDVERSGVICAYPKRAKWNGTGNTADASNYACFDARTDER